MNLSPLAFAMMGLGLQMPAPNGGHRGPIGRGRPRTSLLALHKKIRKSQRDNHRRYIDGDPLKGCRPR